MQADLDHIIRQCKKENPKAQKMLYNLYSSLLYGICLRYMKSPDLAEDVLVEGFYKILTKIKSFQGQGSFEGWMKRIIINEALMKLRKNNVLNLSVELSSINDSVSYSQIISNLNYQALLEVIEQLPPGYKSVFNLYVIDGYKHREIADLLNISINTSKSQLILAKKKLRELIKKKQIIHKIKP